jgi:hypothetical protein
MWVMNLFVVQLSSFCWYFSCAPIQFSQRLESVEITNHYLQQRDKFRSLVFNWLPTSSWPFHSFSTKSFRDYLLHLIDLLRKVWHTIIYISFLFDKKLSTTASPFIDSRWKFSTQSPALNLFSCKKFSTLSWAFHQFSTKSSHDHHLHWFECSILNKTRRPQLDDFDRSQLYIAIM